MVAIEAIKDKFETEFHAKLREAAPTSLSAFVEYMTPEEPPAPHHDFLCEKLEAISDRRLMRAAFSMAPGHAKALALDTPILTDSGFKTMATVTIHDHVFGTDGLLHRVLAKSPVFHNHDCYQVTTSDGETIIADGDHLWRVSVGRRRRVWQTITTRQLFARQSADPEHRATRIPDTPAIMYPHTPLPVDPYVLGAWLGDGTSSGDAMSCGEDDKPFMMEQFTAAGYTVTCAERRNAFNVLGLQSTMRTLRLENNKHIPNDFLQSEFTQRLALLQGLMDTDGTASKDGTAYFCNTNERLINDIRTLLWSLGIPNRRTEGVAKCGGKDCGPYWRVSFSDHRAFRMPRKAARVAHKTARRCGTYIRVTPTDSVSTQCLTTAAPDSLFLAGHSLAVTHNSKFCSKFFPAWYFGKHPLHKYIQGGHSQAFAENEFGKPTRDIIDQARYRDVFPDIRLHPRSTAGGSWRIDNARGSYIAKGVGQKIAGYRGNCGGGDDLIGSREDADSPIIRQKVWDWLWSDFRTRFLPGSPIFLIATRWHPDDPIGRIEAMNKKGIGIPWEIINLPVIIETEQEMLDDPMGRSIGEVLWPDYYTLDQILELKATLPTRDWLSLYKGQPRDADGTAVKATWFQRYDAIPRDDFARGVRRVKRITVSVDTATKKNQRANHSVVGVWMEDVQGHHYLLDVRRERVELTGLIPLIENTAAEWRASTILVEDQGNGTAYIQLRQGKVPYSIIPINPRDGDKEFRFDAVTPIFEEGRVHLPRHAPWLTPYETEILTFGNGGSGADDQVDMTSQYLTWTRRRLALGSKKLKGTGVSKRRATSAH